jgi:hypothetical protein
MDSIGTSVGIAGNAWIRPQHQLPKKGLSKFTLRTTGVSPWVKAFQPKAGVC